MQNPFFFLQANAVAKEIYIYIKSQANFLCLFPFFLDVTDEMLAFFLTLFQALRVQMGVAFTGQIIHTFLSMFTRLTFLTQHRRFDQPPGAAAKH